MSRSIHTTRRDLEEAHRWDYSETEKQAKLVVGLGEDVSTKRRVKLRVRRERETSGEPLPPTDLDLVPVIVRDTGCHIHYPASAEDVRSVMRLLPRGVLDGLKEIELSLGSDCQEKDDDGLYQDDPDPHTGRLGPEILPGVFTGRCQAVYTTGDHRIRLFAYVYDPELRDREMWECYIRLHMLSTFVHEAAHHYDHTMRVARGRWRMDDHPKAEGYAERLQYDWVRDHVVPCVEEAYPEQVKALMDWVEHYGGVRVPLPMIAGDPRATWNNGLVSAEAIFFSIPGAVGSLAQDVYEGKGLNETRLEFARGLHYGTHYDLGLQTIDRVLAGEPGNLDARVLKADIYEHLERHAEARELAEKALERDSDHQDALWVLIDACEQMQDWQVVLDASTRLLDGFELSAFYETRATLSRARAYLEVGRYGAMDEELRAVENRDWGERGLPTYARRRIDELRAEADRRRVV